MTPEVTTVTVPGVEDETSTTSTSVASNGTHVFEVEAVPLLGSGKPDYGTAKRIAQERLAG